MTKRQGFWTMVRVMGACVLSMLIVSCESRDRLVGIYEAPAGGTRQATIVLELKANGDGMWRVVSPEKKEPSSPEEGETPFAWYIKRKDLRINTRAGGVVVGKIRGDTIRIALPGSRALVFKKKQ